MTPTPHFLSSIPLPRSNSLAAKFAGAMLALACFAPAVFANNGTALYFDVNGTTSGFGTPSSTLTYSMIGSVAAVQGTTLATGFANGVAVTSVVVANNTGYVVGQPFVGNGVPSGVTIATISGTGNRTLGFTSFTSTAASSSTYTFGTTLTTGFSSGAAVTSVVVATTNGFAPGDTLIGTGIPASTKITAITGNTLTISFTSTAASSGTYNYGLINWDTTSAGTGTIEIFPSGDQMTFGAAAGDTTCQGAFSMNLDLGSHLNGIYVNSTGCFPTLVGTANTYLDASGTNYVNTGSALTWNDQHNGGFNYGGTSSLTCTYTGGGTNLFLSDFGGNATGIQYETMTGSGTILLDQSTYGVYVLKYGFTLNSGALVFQTATALGNVFSNLLSSDSAVFNINGGSIDNASGSAGTLNVGTTFGIGGNFTFVGSSSLSLSNNGVTLNATPTITVKANTLTIGGVITSGGTYGLTLAGAGTLALTNANTYQGNTTVNGGTLALVGAGAIASPFITLAGGNFDVSGLTTPFGLASGQALALTAPATVNGAVTTTSGAIGLGANTLTLTGDLALGGGTITNTLSTTTSGNNGVLAVTGSLNLSGNTTIQVIYTALQTGRYKLITYTGGYTGSAAANLTLSGIVASGRQTTALDDSIPGEIDLLVTGVAGNLTWVGDGSANNWDTSTENWSNQVTQAADYFFNGDRVTFNDTGSENPAFPVELAGTLTPGSILVTNTGSYVFSSGGSLDGNASLTKQGPGTLTLNETGGDSFAGGITVSGGTLDLAETSAAIAGGLTVSGGLVMLDQVSSTFTGNTTINSGGTVELGNNDANGTLPSGTVTDNGTLVLTNSSNLNLPNVIAGSGVLSQMNSSSVTLMATNSGFTGTVLANGGTVIPANTNALGSWTAGAVTATNGGTLDLGGFGAAYAATPLFGPKQFYISGLGVGGNGAIINSGSFVEEGGIESITLTANSTIGGATRWDMRSGTVSLNLNNFTLTKTNANLIALVNPNVAGGNVIIGQGDLSFQSTPVFTGSGTITVNPGGSVGEYKDPQNSFTRNVVLNGGTVVNDSGAASAYLDAPILLTANSTLHNPGGWQYFDGVISDGGAGYGLTNNGVATNVLSAISTYSGNTLITAGTLSLVNTGSISSSAMISVNANGKFDISGLSLPCTGTNSLVLGDDSLGAGTLNLGTTLITNFNYLSLSNAVVNLAVANPAVPNITVTNLNVGDGGASSTINVTALPPGAPPQFPLISYVNLTGIYNLSLVSLPPGYTGQLVNNTQNNSIDLQLSGYPAGAWTGGSLTDSDWSDSANWGGVNLSGNDFLYFNVATRLSNTNDLSFPEAATGIYFGPGAGAFVLYGNPVTLLNGGLVNNSASLQTVNLGLDFGTNITINGGAAGVIIGGGLTNILSGTNMTMLTLAGTGILTNLLNSVNSSGGTNTINVNSSSANWSIVDNSTATAISVPWVLNFAQGTLNFGTVASSPNLSLNAPTGDPQDDVLGSVTGGTATLNITNGTLTTLGRLDTATANSSTGMVNQVGGTLNIGNMFQGANGGTSNALSLFNLRGGTVNINGGTGPFYVASRDQGILNLNGGMIDCGVLDVSRNASGNTQGSSGVVNLNGGILNVGSVGTATANTQAGPPSSGVNPAATFNFNGGTLKASGSSATFFQGSLAAPVIPITTIVKAGGAIIDTTNHGVTIGASLQHDSTLGGTPDGGLLKLGTGTLTLTNACTYTGNTVVSNGTLVLNGSLGTTAVTVATNATLSGTGSAGGNVTINAGGTLLPATDGTLGIFTVAGNAALQGTATLYINQSTATNDVLQAGSVTYGGALNVTNLAGTLAANNSFKLVNAAGYSGSFAATNLPALGAGLGWNWNPVSGILSVVPTMNVNPTNVTATLTGGVLALYWPPDHTGWTLQMQTNSLSSGLSTNWVDVPGSANINSTNITIDPTKPTIFYRLSLYP